LKNKKTSVVYLKKNDDNPGLNYCIEISSFNEINKKFIYKFILKEIFKEKDSNHHLINSFVIIVKSQIDLCQWGL